MRTSTPDLDRRSLDRSRQAGTGRLRRTLVTLGLAVIMVFGFAGIASAATFSPYLPPTGYTWGDCTIKTGPVKDDSQTSHGFAAIGGGYLSCRAPHTFQVWVQEYFALPGQTYYAVGATGHTSGTNAYGLSDLQLTSRICGTGYWYTVTTISVSGWGTHAFPGTANYVAALGKSAAAC